MKFIGIVAVTYNPGYLFSLSTVKFHRRSSSSSSPRIIQRVGMMADALFALAHPNRVQIRRSVCNNSATPQRLKW